MRSIIFATGNEHKAQEVSQMLEGRFAIQSLKSVGFTDDIPETGSSFKENALQKARFVFERFGKACFADDSGLVVQALDGAPGIFSARYAGEPKSDEANNQKLLKELKDKEDRSAKFVCVIAFIDESGQDHLFEGVVNGEIRTSLDGKGGFGYDPLFQPEGYETTFAEMEGSEKNQISHRGRAIEKLRKYLIQSSMV